MTREPDSEFLSEEEIERWANILADEFCNPESFWRVRLLQGWEAPDLMSALSPSLEVAGAQGPFYPSLIPPLRSVILSNNREDLFNVCRKILSVLPRSSFELFRGLANPRNIRKILLAEANKVKDKPGRPQKLRPSQYTNLVRRADSLYPVLLRLLRELQSGSKHTPTEVLDFLAKDYERPVSYLHRHISKLENALKDPKYILSAKRIETRAKRLASGLAGCDDEYKFSTSLERVGEARRKKKSTLNQNSRQKE